MINVTKSYLPSLDSYVRQLEKVWKTGWITNNGELVQELEKRLSEYLGVTYLQYLSNGTIALQIALRALEIQGEVITTPFSYVATTNSILWERCTPIFVDIDPHTLCIDSSKIESAITKNTRAIMAVHVYGYPCDVKGIQSIADNYGLKVIYDAAHAFGCKLDGKSILNWGDISTLSFHATKLFHTVEGGAVVSKTFELSDMVNKQKSFGHIGEEYYMLGVNGKNSEFHAAMGLCVLPNVEEIIQNRKLICEAYNAEFHGLNITFSNIPDNYEYNYAYYPVIFNDENQLLSVKKALLDNQVNPRRYFYPSLNTLPFIQDRQSCPVSENISSRVLCLPLFYGLEIKDVQRIAKVVKIGMGL